MQIQKISNQNYIPNFQAKFLEYNDSFRRSDLFKIAFGNLNNGRGKRFFEALKKVSMYTNDVLDIEAGATGWQPNEGFLDIINKTNGKIFSKKFYYQSLDNNDFSLRVLEFIEYLGKKNSYIQQEVFGTDPQIVPHAKGRYFKTDDWLTYQHKNMYQFIV